MALTLSVAAVSNRHCRWLLTYSLLLLLLLLCSEFCIVFASFTGLSGHVWCLCRVSLCVCAFALVTSMKYAAGKGHFDWQAKYAHAHTVWTQQQKSIPRIAQFQSLLIRFVVGDRTNTFKSISFVQLCSSWCVCLPFFVCLRAHQTWWLKFGQKKQEQNGVEHQQHKKCTKSAPLLWH